MEQFQYEHLLIFCLVLTASFALVLYLLPRLLLGVYKRAILNRGFGEGPVPINTLYIEPKELFKDPIKASGSKLMTTGVNRDTLMILGWLDLSMGPKVLQVPDMGERYYSVHFTDPSKNVNFAYVGKRTTGTKPGEYLICGPNWKGILPLEISKISSPNNSVLVVGRVLVYNENDISKAHELAQQIKLFDMK